GRGTRMTIYLPRSSAAAAAASDDDDAMPHKGSGQFILLVEDNPEVASVTATMLNELGYREVTAPSVDAALEILRERDDIALVLSDIVMPGSRDGIALAQAMREHHASVPILLATGYSRAAEGALGEFPLLRKPYQLGDLGRAITNLLA